MDGGRALVLGGGGIAGIAWEAGLLAGLAAEGVDLTDADLVVGTSAGSIVGTFVTQGGNLAEAVKLMATRDDGSSPTPAGSDLEVMLTSIAILFDASLDPREARARVGKMAVESATGHRGAMLEEVGRHLPRQDWPHRRLLITGVDVQNGEFVVWDRHSAVPLALAVRASCSVPGIFPPVEINGSRYMDGGVRSVTNADLAKGASTVVVIEPLAHLFPRHVLERELAALGDAKTAAIGPDQTTIDTFGTDLLSSRLWGPAFEAGHAQAPAAAEHIGPVWTSTPSTPAH